MQQTALHFVGLFSCFPLREKTQFSPTVYFKSLPLKLGSLSVAVICYMFPHPV